MDNAIKDKFKEVFGSNIIFEDEILNICHHELIMHQFHLDPRMKHYGCKCGKEEYLECTKACADEMLMDKDTRNVPHKVKNHTLIELFGIEIRIVD